MDKRFVAGLIFAMSVARGQTPGSTGKLTVTVGKSLIIDSPVNIRIVSVANGELIEAIAVNPREVLINGKTPGETSVVIEQVNGNRLVYDLTVGPRPAKLEEVRQQISREFPDDNIDVSYENDTALVRGTVKDVIAADRVIAIVATLGKTINLLRVDVPPFEGQTSLRVRFASVDRDVETDLGLNLISAAPIIDSNSGGAQPIPSVNQLVNVFLFRPDINLLSTLRALEARNALEMLAEPNVMAIDGKQASFVAGGVFPFPTMQAGAVTIQFREIGVRLNFLPNITPRGTIRLQVASEANSLDYAHSVTFQGFNIPALTTRRALTEVELNSGQSFVIGGLLDNSTTENLSKTPGLADIPMLGKLVQSKTKSNTELLVIITPEVVRPIAAGRPGPSPPRDPPPPSRLPELDSPLPPSSPAVPFFGSSPSPERRG